MNNWKSLKVALKRDWQLYMFLLLPVTYIVVFAYIPMLGLQIAFRSFQAQLGSWNSPWVGFLNFRKFFSSFYFLRVLKNTLILSGYAIVFSFPFPIITALLMNTLRFRKFKNFCQTVITLPHFISVVVLVGMINQFFNARYGLYGNIVYKLIGAYPADPFSNPGSFRHMYIWSGIWQTFGWNSIIYLAALTSVSPSLHEAAMIDGASRWKRMLHIDIPSILPTIVIMLIMRTGSVMNIGFEKVFLMQNDINLKYSEIITTYVYKVGLSADGNTDFSYSTAIGFFNSIVNMILISVVNMVSNRVSGTSMW